ncbi:MAG: DUF87 domain-containing protein [Candidatus Jordarchaeales archaeon]
MRELERGRPVCELLHMVLEQVEGISIQGGGGASAVSALAAAYQLTGKGEFLEAAKAEAERLAGILLGGGEAGETLFVAAHALRVASQLGEKRASEALNKIIDYALRAERADLQLLRVLLEGYWATGRSDVLSRMMRDVEGLAGEERARGLLVLYGATGEKRFLDEAAGVLGGEEALLACWEMCGFEPDFYPRSAKVRSCLFGSLSFDDAYGAWRTLSALRGELKVRRDEGVVFAGGAVKVSVPLRVMLDDVGEGVVLGRTREQHEKAGCRGLAYVGRVWEEGELVGRPVLLDVLKPHVVFICGQRGSGKSYTMGVLAEELARSGLGVAVVIIDPVGVFWSMKQPNRDEGEVRELDAWGLRPRGFSNVRVFVPLGVYEKLPEATRDAPFSVKPSELTVDDWCYAFGIERFSPTGLLLEKALMQVREGYAASVNEGEVYVEGKGDSYSVDDLVRCIETSTEILSRERGFKADTRRAVVSRLLATKEWGLFSGEGTPIEEVVKPGMVTVIDVSALAGDGLRGLVAGLLARRILERRMKQARAEKAGGVEGGDIPVTWLMVDEAHVLVPAKGETAASKPLIEYAKLGRMPGCALVLATQQPSATSDQVLSQVDVVLAHRLVFELDIEAFTRRAPNTVPGELAGDAVRKLPAGVALVSDGTVETGRTFAVKVRPRLSRHAGREVTPRLKTEKEEGVTEEAPAVGETVEQAREAPAVASSISSVALVEEPALAVIDAPQDLALDYLSRLVKYRFYEYIYQSPRVETTGLQIAVKASPGKVLGKLKETLKAQGWTLSEHSGEELVVIAERSDVKLAVALALGGDATLVAVEVAASSRDAAAKVKDALESTLREAGVAEWAPPPSRRKPEKRLPEKEGRVEEVKEAGEEVKEAGEEVKVEEGKVGGAEEAISPEEAAAKIQRIQKYLQSLHEYYSLGRMTEEEYLFLKRKAFRKIEELKRALQR